MIRALIAALAGVFAAAAPAAAQPKLCMVPCATQCRPLTGPALAECEARCAAQHQQLCAVPAAKPAPQGTGGVGHAPPASHHYLHHSAAPSPAPAPPPAPPPAPMPPPPAAPHAPAGGYPAGGYGGALPVPAAPPPSPDVAASDDTQPIATRLFADAQFRVPDDFGAIAVLIFPSDAAADTARVTKVCAAFVNAMLPSPVVAQALPRAQQMVTLWPVVAGSAALDPNNQDVHGAGADGHVCPAAVHDYDYVEAAVWQGRLPKSVSYGGQGPFLVAWAPATAAGQPHVPILLYDLSAFTTPTALKKAMRIWTDEIEGNPAAWRNGWDLTRFRLQAAAEADAVGGEILAAIKLVPFIDSH